MSWLSKFIDNHITHSSERREARERSDKQIAEYDALKAETKSKSDQIDKEKKYEANRVNASKVRRMRGGSRKTGFLNESTDNGRQDLADKLG
jgi:hypothetical protein